MCKRLIVGWTFFTIYFLTSSTYSLALSPSTVSEIISKIESKRLWRDPYWAKLLHYKNSFYQFKSQIPDKSFFTDSQGHKDLKAEMLATVAAFFEDQSLSRVDEKMPAICKYPARFNWLKENLGLSLPVSFKDKCKSYWRFRKLIEPKDVWFVFSSYYLNNPSSAFGHTFLKFTRNLDNENDLLDHGVNFAANPTTRNPLLYPLYGMIGKFKGKFSIVPYFAKVREYSDYESRDLWGYQLNFTLKEKRVLVDHLWELGSTWFDYYFFTGNCSYHLLTLFEVAKPSLKLVDQLPFWIIPSDTVQVVAKEKNFVSQVKFRPSLYRLFRKRRKNLPRQDQIRLASLINNRSMAGIKSLPSIAQAGILDAALDYMEYKHPSLVQEQDQETNEFKYQILNARAKISYITPKLELRQPVVERPDLGHGSGRFALGVQSSNTGLAYYLIEQRFAHHDFLDPSVGYPSQAKIEFLHLKGKISNEDFEPLLDQLSIITIESFPTFSLDENVYSWVFDIGVKHLEALKYTNKYTMYLTVGSGFSLNLFHSKVLFSLIGKLNLLQAWTADNNGHRNRFAQIEPSSSLYYRFSSKQKLGLATNYTHTFQSNIVDDVVTTLSFRSEIRHNHAWEALASHGRSKHFGLKYYYYY